MLWAVVVLVLVVCWQWFKLRAGSRLVRFTLCGQCKAKLKSDRHHRAFARWWLGLPPGRG